MADIALRADLSVMRSTDRQRPAGRERAELLVKARKLFRNRNAKGDVG